MRRGFQRDFSGTTVCLQTKWNAVHLLGTVNSGLYICCVKASHRVSPCFIAGTSWLLNLLHSRTFFASAQQCVTWHLTASSLIIACYSPFAVAGDVNSGWYAVMGCSYSSVCSWAVRKPMRSSLLRLRSHTDLKTL